LNLGFKKQERKKMIISVTNNFNIDYFIADLDYALKQLNISTNLYYNKWVEDVKKFINSAPETNLNFSGYLFQKRRIKLLSQFKYFFLNQGRQPRVVGHNSTPLPSQAPKSPTFEDMQFLLLQPELKQLFDKYSIIINWSLTQN